MRTLRSWPCSYVFLCHGAYQIIAWEAKQTMFLFL